MSGESRAPAGRVPRIRPADIRRLCLDINRRHAALNLAVARRRESPGAWQDWERAVAAFHDGFSHELFSLWDPEVLADIRDADGAWRAVALDVLQEDPWFFRSGYLKARLCRALKQAPHLGAADVARIRRILLAVVQSRHREEFVHFQRLALRVDGPDLRQALVALCGHPAEPEVRRRAQWMLGKLTHHAPTLGATDATLSALMASSST